MPKRGAIARLYDAVIRAGKATTLPARAASEFLATGSKSALRMLHAASGEAGLARMIGPYGGGGYGSTSGQSFGKAEQVLHFKSWSFRCVDYIANSVSSVPPVAVRVESQAAAKAYRLREKAFLNGRGRQPEARAFAPPWWAGKAAGPARANEEYEFLDNDHDLVRLLADPNDPETGVNFWYEAEMFNCLTGVDYVWKVEDDRGRVESLWVIPSHWVREVCTGTDRLVDYFEVSPRGGTAGLVRFSPDEIIWNRRPSPLSKIFPASPLQAVAATVDAYEKIEAGRNFGLDNGMSVAGVLTAAPGSFQLDDVMIQRLEARFMQKYGGVFNTNRPMILEGGLTWTPPTGAVEAAFKDSLDQGMGFIISLWGLDKAVLGDSQGAAWAGVLGAIRNVDHATIQPRKRTRAAVLTEKLARDFGDDVRIFYPPNIPADPDARRQDFAAGSALNAVAPNDYRTHVLELEPFPEEIYDRPLVSPGLVNPGQDSGGGWDMDGSGAGAGDAAPVDGTGADDFGDADDDGPGDSGDVRPFSGGGDDGLKVLAVRERVVAALNGKAHGPPPFPGAVFSESSHRWEKPGHDGDAQPKPGRGSKPSGNNSPAPQSNGTDWHGPAKVVVADPQTAETWAKVVGDHVPPHAAGALVGAPAGATVKVSRAGDGIKIEVDHPHYDALREIHRDGDTVVMHNLYIEINKSAQGKGLGADIFGRQVDACRKAGIGAVECSADGPPNNGYYTWPRFGYDAPLAGLEKKNPQLLATIREKFPGAETIQDVIKTADGRGWWKANGKTLPRARFDLTDGSRSMQIISAYRAEKGGSGGKQAGGRDRPDGGSGRSPGTGVGADRGRRRTGAVGTGPGGLTYTGSWLGKHGAPPFPGAVLNPNSHRWEKPDRATAVATAPRGSVADAPEVHARRCSRIAATIKQYGRKAIDAAITVGARAYELGLRAQWAAMNSGLAVDDVIDTAHDYSKLINAKIATPLSEHLGIGGNTAAVVASHVLAYGIAKLKQAIATRRITTGKATPDDSDRAAAVAEVVRELLGPMGVPESDLPTADDVAAWLADRNAGAKSATKGHGPPPWPGAVFDAGKHRWVRGRERDRKRHPPAAKPTGAARPSAAPRVAEKAPSEKATRARAAHVLVDKHVQRYAEEVNEPRFAKTVGGVSFPDSEPVDVVIAGKTGAVAHGIELKTMVLGKDDKLTMNAYAQVRKKAWEQDKKATFHTIVSDDRAAYSPDGKHDDSKRVYYYRRGIAGSARIGTMHRAASEAELKKLMTMPDDQLPDAAQRTEKSWLTDGKWVPLKGERGYRNTKTGQEVRPKK